MTNYNLPPNKISCPRICSLPWTTLVVDNNGDVFFCCYQFPFANINNISDSKNAINEIWNGEAAQDLRRRWNEGRLEGTPCGRCEGLARFKKYEHIVKNISDLSNRTANPFFSNAKLNFDEFNKGEIILKSMPVEIVYIPSTLCNLDCIFCFQPPTEKVSCLKTDSLLKFYKYLGSRAIRNVFSGGEPLYIRQTYRLLDEFSPAHKAASEAIFQTNGSLIKDKYKLIKDFKKCSFRISIAAFEKKRYEYLQKGASFEKLIDNLKFLAKLKSSGDNISLDLVMVLMKSNFIDLEGLFEFAETYKFGEVWVTPIHPAFGGILFREDIFQFPHLLEKIPSWQDILEKTSQKAKMIKNKPTYYHLEYIRSQLPSSVMMGRYYSIRNLFLWKLKRVIVEGLIQWPPLSPVKKLLKLILKIKVFKKLYH